MLARRKSPFREKRSAGILRIDGESNPAPAKWIKVFKWDAHGSETTEFVKDCWNTARFGVNMKLYRSLMVYRQVWCEYEIVHKFTERANNSQRFYTGLIKFLRDLLSEKWKNIFSSTELCRILHRSIIKFSGWKVKKTDFPCTELVKIPHKSTIKFSDLKYSWTLICNHIFEPKTAPLNSSQTWWRDWRQKITTMLIYAISYENLEMREKREKIRCRNGDQWLNFGRRKNKGQKTAQLIYSLKNCVFSCIELVIF